MPSDSCCGCQFSRFTWDWCIRNYFERERNDFGSLVELADIKNLFEHSESYSNVHRAVRAITRELAVTYTTERGLNFQGSFDLSLDQSSFNSANLLRMFNLLVPRVL